MNTIYTTLPFYDNPAKRDSNVNVLRWSPRNRLPGFLLQRAASNDKIASVSLFNRAGTELDITGYLPSDNADLVTSFTDGGMAATFSNTGNYFDVTGAVDPANIDSSYFAITTGDKVVVRVFNKVISGTVNPETTTVQLHNGSISLSNEVAVSVQNGVTVAVLTATGSDANAMLRLTYVFTSSAQWRAYVTVQKITDPLDEKSLTTYDYFQYKNWNLAKWIPEGEYYLKINDGKKYWYSDWVSIADIYTNLLTGWTNDGMATLVTNTGMVVYAVNGAGNSYIESNTFTCYADNPIVVECTYDTPGSMASVNICLIEGTTVISNVETIATASNGSKKAVLTPTRYSSTAQVRIGVASGSSCQFCLSDVMVRRNTPDDLLNIEFYNASDVGNLLYQDSFVQSAWLKGFIKHGRHVTEREGEERNGEYLMERVITKHEHRAVVHVTENLHRALELLPNHESVTIRYNTDEYNAINVKVEDPTWFTKRGLLEIGFSTANDLFVQRGNLTNLT